MHREIILAAFAKAKKEELEESGIQASTTRTAERIAAYIANHSSVPYGERMLRDSFKRAHKPDSTVEVKQPLVVKALCNYIGYESYKSYLIAQEGPSIIPKKPKEEGANFLGKYYQWMAVLGLLIVVGFSLYLFSNRQRWMVWDETHYIEVSFDGELLQKGMLKLLKEDRIENFKKVTLACDSIFFNNNRTPRFWYGKNGNKELEFFSELAKHPETGKALSPITQYMIDKYVCDD